MALSQERSRKCSGNSSERPKGVFFFQWRVIQGNYLASYIKDFHVCGRISLVVRLGLLLDLGLSSIFGSILAFVLIATSFSEIMFFFIVYLGLLNYL